MRLTCSTCRGSLVTAWEETTEGNNKTNDDCDDFTRLQCDLSKIDDPFQIPPFVCQLRVSALQLIFITICDRARRLLLIVEQLWIHKSLQQLSSKCRNDRPSQSWTLPDVTCSSDTEKNIFFSDKRTSVTETKRCRCRFNEVEEKCEAFTRIVFSFHRHH